MQNLKRNTLINRAKQESAQKGRFSLVLEEKRLREFMRFENGEMILYDITGKDKSQVSLSNEELRVIKEMEDAATNHRNGKAKAV